MAELVFGDNFITLCSLAGAGTTEHPDNWNIAGNLRTLWEMNTVISTGCELNFETGVIAKAVPSKCIPKIGSLAMHQLRMIHNYNNSASKLICLIF